MESLIGLIILYIIFSFISSLVGKSNTSGQTLQQRQPHSDQSESPVEKYLSKFEEIFFPTRPPVKRTPLRTHKIDSSQPSTSPSPEFELPEPEPEPTPRGLSDHLPRNDSLLSIDPHHGYIQAVIMSEILAPPVSKRRQRVKI